ncbi:MAG: DUF4383 domain-containing protein [Nitrospirae bacterium]|nr:DUF4383 domain-containing protein [Candidatus Manganitrophaceae bacterium]
MMSTLSKSVLTLGIIFVIIGIWGFFQNPILGLFLVNTPHNWIHLISGILAIVFASSGEVQARQFSKVFGVIYGLLALVGFFMPRIHSLGFMVMNRADDWLHLILAAAFLYFGFSRVYGTHRPMHGAPARG